MDYVSVLNDYLINDLNNLENCLTTLVLANMKEVSLYLRDINNVLRFAAGMNNKRFEFYQSPLINTVKNCRVYDNQTNKLWQEYIDLCSRSLLLTKIAEQLYIN